jgi:hypothetical protein
VRKSYLLRFQEPQVGLDRPDAQPAAATGQPDYGASKAYDTRTNPRQDMETATAVPSERPDLSAASSSCGALPARTAATDTLTLTYIDDEAPRNDDLRDRSAMVLPVTGTATKTAIKGEQPDRSAASGSCTSLPERTTIEILYGSLTYTFVKAEEPRKDEGRRSALVLPACS